MCVSHAFVCASHAFVCVSHAFRPEHNYGVVGVCEEGEGGAADWMGLPSKQPSMALPEQPSLDPEEDMPVGSRSANGSIRVPTPVREEEP